MKQHPLAYLASIVFILFGSLLMHGQMMNHGHHDFKETQWNGTSICMPCHPGSGVNKETLSLPIWINKTLSPFEVYSDSPLDRDPGSTSKLCLSCHDGTMGNDSYTEFHNSYILPDTGIFKLNMMTSHPVSIIYHYQEGGISRNKLNDPNTTMSGLGGTIAEDLLINGKVECTSCHDIHVTRNMATCKGCHTMSSKVPSSASLTLWITNDYSALCRTCHLK